MVIWEFVILLSLHSGTSFVLFKCKIQVKMNNTKINKMLRKGRFHFVIFFSVIMAGVIFFSTTKDTCSEVNKCILAGDAQQLSKYFLSTVELSVLGKEGYFSKVQAVSVLLEFFKNNPPKDFIVKKGGSNSENTKFSIGTYESTNGNSFKVYYVVKKEQDLEFVSKLTIEKR